MMTFIRPRLRKPLGIALAGTVFATGWALRGGDAWQLSIAMEVTVLVSAITTYLRAGEDNDEGALAGSRADERQKLLSLRSRALGWNFAMVAAFIGITVGVAVKAVWWWPFLVILAVEGLPTCSACRTTVSQKKTQPMMPAPGTRHGPRPADELLPPTSRQRGVRWADCPHPGPVPQPAHPGG
jgi:hypothetical protein